MFIIKMKLQDETLKNLEWNLQGFDSRPLRFMDYGTAEREAMYQKEKYSSINGFSCHVVEEKGD